MKRKKIIKLILLTITCLIILAGVVLGAIAGYNIYQDKKYEHWRELWEARDKAIADSLRSDDISLRNRCIHNNFERWKNEIFHEDATLAIERSQDPDLLFDMAKVYESRPDCLDGHPGNFSTSQSAYKMAYTYMLAAEAGHPTAQAEYARCLYDGFGTSINYDEAFEWAQKSAEAGDSVGIFMLGVCYTNGAGVQADREYGRSLLRKSAETGYLRAQTYLMQTN